MTTPSPNAVPANPLPPEIAAAQEAAPEPAPAAAEVQPPPIELPDPLADLRSKFVHAPQLSAASASQLAAQLVWQNVADRPQALLPAEQVLRVLQTAIPRTAWLRDAAAQSAPHPLGEAFFTSGELTESSAQEIAAQQLRRAGFLPRTAEASAAR